MTDQIERTDPDLTLSTPDRLRAARAMAEDYEAFLAPGERFAVHGEVGEEYIWAEVVLRAADDSFKLELEAAMSASDLALNQMLPQEPQRGLEVLFDFLRLQLYEFFRSDRRERFHVDWRLYDLGPVRKVRFRAQQSRPELERKADRILEEDAAQPPAEES